MVDSMGSDRYKQDIVVLRIFTTNVYCSRESSRCGRWHGSSQFSHP